MTRVLLVEDDEFLAELYVSQLKSHNIEVISVNSAQLALDKLDELNADLILLDIVMPGHGGIEVLHELNSHSDWRELPVIIMSSQPQSRFGAVDWSNFSVREYIYKPELDLSTLALRIQDALV